MTQEAAKKERVAKVIEVLNKARSMELYAVHQYMNQHYNLDDMDYGELAANMKLIAIDEMRHAENFAERIKELGGAYVSSVVEGGSASEAGIRKGDVILDIDGVKINDNATLSEQIGRRRPNDKVKLSVKRDGKVKQIDVTLRNKAGKTELVTKEDVDVVDALGGKFADAGAKLCRELDIKGGVQVVGIKADGILARARVKQGFVITHINDRPVYSLSDMERMTDKVRSIDGIYPNGRAASYVLVE